MKRKIRQKLEKMKRRAARRLARARKRKDTGRPVFVRLRPKYEVAERTRGLAHGGIGAMHQLVQNSGLVEELDARLHLLKVHRPYHESDHVLNIVYNIICGGRSLEDIELRRNDEVFLDALEVEAIPDPTTAGDFCRRFSTASVEALMDAINAVRVRIWKRRGPEFIEQTARIDADGTLVSTSGECKEGMALSYKGVWGYHPLLISLANTNEPLFVVNRSGNRPSQEGAAHRLDQAIGLCRQAGFTDILLRGDTDFSQTEHLDRWAGDGVRFVFGYDAMNNLKQRADGLSGGHFHELARRAKRAFVEADKRRTKPARHKEAFVRAKGYKNIRLRSEDVAEFDYRPVACKQTYRMVVLRKNLSVEKGENHLFDDIRYFFYITNDRDMSAAEVVFESNHRCNQENLIEQLKNGARALYAPVDSLVANWAYMVMASLAWTLKAWMALSLPIMPRWKDKHRAEQERWLRMDFRTFRASVIEIPTQILRHGRQLVYRFLSWKPQMSVLFRLLDAL